MDVNNRHKGIFLALLIGANILFLPNTFATAYTAPPQTAPITMSNGDSFTNNLGSTFDAATTDPTWPYTLEMQQDATVTNLGTITYTGSYLIPSTIYSYRSNNATQTISNSGTISAPSNGYSIFLQNLGVNTDIITLQSTGNIIGNTYIDTCDTVQTFFGTSTIAGNITLNNVTTSSMVVGQASGGGALTGSIANISAGIYNFNTLTVTNSSLLILGYDSTINTITINLGSTLSSYALTGSGNFTNNGIATISGDVNMLGTFVSSGTVFFRSNSFIFNSSYDVTGTHVAQLYDVLNFGSVTLATVGVTNLNAFSMFYPAGGGYFPSGEYILFTSQADIAQNPTFTILPYSSRYITFSNLAKSTDYPATITVTMTRTPYQYYITTNPEFNIAQNLEAIGIVLNQNVEVVTMLDAVERSYNNTMLFTALEQFLPITTPSIYALTVQNDGMEQAELRLASLRQQSDTYLAGDYSGDDYFWIRPFGGYGNQRKQDTTYGYYAGTGGLAFGMDKRFSDYFLTGIGGAYSRSFVRDKRNANTYTHFKTFQFLWYGNFELMNSSYVDFVFSAIQNKYTSSRFLNINNLFLTSDSNYDNNQFSLQGIYGKKFQCGSCQITPEASAQYTFIKQYSYKETGVSNAATLNVAHQNSNILQFGLGGKFAKFYDCYNSVMIPEVHGNAYYNLINGIQNTTFAFLYGGSNMVATFNNPRLMFKVGAAFTVLSYRDIEFKANYDYLFQNHYTGYNVYLNIRYRL